MSFARRRSSAVAIVTSVALGAEVDAEADGPASVATE
jgi:hypothetical protein